MLTRHSLVDKQSLALVCLDNGRVKSSRVMIIVSGDYVLSNLLRKGLDGADGGSSPFQNLLALVVFLRAVL